MLLLTPPSPSEGGNVYTPCSTFQSFMTGSLAFVLLDRRATAALRSPAFKYWKMYTMRDNNLKAHAGARAGPMYPRRSHSIRPASRVEPLDVRRLLAANISVTDFTGGIDIPDGDSSP